MRFDDDVKWQAVIDCNPDFDGLFYYVVKTVGVCCRPSCRSRTPKRENVVYFDTLADAEAAGYRPCRRCRPDQADTDPMDGIIWQARDLIDTHYGQRQLLAERMRELGVSSGQLAKVFRERVGCAPGEYLNRVRARHARELLDAGTPITDVAFALGFEALGAFYRMFKQETGQTPQQYRDRRSTTTFAECESPIGKLVAVAAAGSLVRLLLPTDSATDIGVPGSGGVLDEAIGQLDEYFNAARREFDLPISPRGTAFQRSVWDALRRIGYGRTASYAAIAAQVGSPKAARAVGQANNRNPIPVVIPCHRVIGSGGSLVGFRGGVDAKRWLLEHELSHA